MHTQVTSSAGRQLPRLATLEEGEEWNGGGAESVEGVQRAWRA